MSLHRLYPRISHSLPTESFHPFSSPTRLPSLCGCKRSGLIRWKLCRPRTMTPPPCILPNASSPGMDAELFLTNAVEELGLEWSPQRNHPVAAWMNGSCQGRCQAPRHRASPFSQRSTTRSPILGVHPTCPAYVPRLLPPSPRSTARKKKDATTCLAWMSQWLCISVCQGHWLEGKTRPSSKPCRMISALAGRAYSSAGQASSALHSMTVLQVFHAKLPRSMDESNPNPAAFN